MGNIFNQQLFCGGSSGPYDFNDFFNGQNVSIYTSGTTIPSYGCYGLTSIQNVNGPNVTNIGERAFQNCTSLVSVSLSDGLTSIGSHAFQNCSSLASISLPDGLTSIGEYAFRDCTSLVSISLLDGLTSIGDGTFAYCSGLTSVSLSDGLTSIGNSAFRYCTSLVIIDLTDFNASASGFTVPTLGTSVFGSGASVRKFYFRDTATLNAFAAATNWSAYANDFTTDPVPSS